MTRTDRVLASAVEAIGNTPLVELARLTKGMDGRILAKMEYLNPGLSKKDRIARQIIEEAEAARRSQARPDRGGTDQRQHGHRSGDCLWCQGLPLRGRDVERQLHGTGPHDVRLGRRGRARGPTAGFQARSSVRWRPGTGRKGDAKNRPRAWRFQGRPISTSRQPARPLPEHGTRDYPANRRLVYAFCDFAGTGGSFAGCSAAFKEHDPSIRCFIVEPEGAAVLAGEQVTNPNHRIQGGGYSMATLPLLRPEHVDGYLQVSEAEAIRTARLLAKQEGIFAGFSSGANVAAALQLLKGECRGNTIVVLLCDSGLKYLSTDLWDSTSSCPE